MDARFLGTHARLTISYRYLDVSEQIARNRRPQHSMHISRKGQTVIIPKNQRNSFSLSGLLKRVCLGVWLIFPNKARVAAYKLLRTVGFRLYGSPNQTGCVRRLPFGLYLKFLGDPEGFRNESNALQLVRKYTTIPVPRPLDVVCVPTSSGDGP